MQKDDKKDVNEPPPLNPPSVEHAPHRIINLPNPTPASNCKSNSIHTSKYTFFTFIPKNLFEQFKSIANFYFLFLVLLQLFPPFNIAPATLTSSALLLVVCITAIKDATEDWRRHVSDKSVNNWNTYILIKNKRQKANGSLKIAKMWFSRLFNGESDDGRKEYLMTEDYYDGSEKEKRVSVTTPKPPSQNQPIWGKQRWKNVKVGDIILLQNNDLIPADVLILSTSSVLSCFIETKNLDGETNLKVKHGPKDLSYLITPDDCANLKCSIQLENPTVHISSFFGNLRLEDENGKEKIIPLDINSILLRGCTLRNTDWVIGIVAYTGAETKLMMNQGETPSKRSKIDRQMNPQILMNFMILASMCLICGWLGALYGNHFHFGNPPFIFSADGISAAQAFFVTFVNSLIIFQNIVPIAIFIGISVSKSFQSWIIHQDLDMYDPEYDRSCTPKSWNLCDDLGQVEYIFSDKTGTLTRNEMAFRRCTIGGVVYGVYNTNDEEEIDPMISPKSPKFQSQLAEQHIITEKRMEILEQKMRRNMDKLFDTKFVTAKKFSFIDTKLHLHLAEGMATVNENLNFANQQFTPSSHATGIIDFFTLLAVCHTVLVENKDKELTYKAQSPDEEALVSAARDVGFTFIKRVEDKLEVDILGTSKCFRVLHILEFDSFRKRMSIIVQKEGDDEVILLCKGADSVIFDRINRPEGDDAESVQYRKMLQMTDEHLEMFANEGLRTLCLAYKIISTKEYISWAEEYEHAQSLMENRDAEVAKVAALIEEDLILIGATAIEDKLQEGVPECIATLGKAGIKIWVLTGDKMETAISIGYSCNLLTQKMLLIVIKSTESEEQTIKQIKEALVMFWDASGKNKREVETEFGLAIDGESLRFALSESCKSYLLELACRCKSVICCRVSPLQKAQVVALVRKGLGVMCLSIGDGANDVSMIQEADIGVGISGKEGVQASMASDFAISQFRFLSKLLLVHGRWAYMRTAGLILFYFYKNIVFLFILFWYQFDSGFTGDLIMEYSYGMFYNTFFVSAPNMIVGVFDQDINAEIALAFPEIYYTGLSGSLYTMEKFWLHIFEAIYQSVVLYYSALMQYGPATQNPDGKDGSKDMVGTVLVIYAVYLVNITMLIRANSLSWTGWALFFVSTIIFTVYIFIDSASLDAPSFGVSGVLFYQPTFYFGMLLTLFTAMLPKFAVSYALTNLKPEDINILQEIQKFSWEKSETPQPSAIENEKGALMSPKKESRKSSMKETISKLYSPTFEKKLSEIIKEVEDEQVDLEDTQVQQRLSVKNMSLVPADVAFSSFVDANRLSSTERLSSVSKTSNAEIESKPRTLRIPSVKEGPLFISMGENPLSANLHSEMDLRKKLAKSHLSIITSPKSNKGTSIVFMDTHSESANRGFCFSHDGGMESIISPSQNKSRLSLSSPSNNDITRISTNRRPFRGSFSASEVEPSDKSSSNNSLNNGKLAPKIGGTFHNSLSTNLEESYNAAFQQQAIGRNIILKSNRLQEEAEEEEDVDNTEEEEALQKIIDSEAHMLNKDGGSSMDLLESESFKMLELVSQELPLPIFAANDNSNSESELQEQPSFLSKTPSVIDSNDTSFVPFSSDTSSTPIQTTQHFFKWFANIEDEMEKDQENIYRSYLSSVIIYRDTCDELLLCIENAFQMLDDLMTNYNFVENKSRALQNACEKLLQEQTHLGTIAQELSEKLAYFNELEPLTKLLSSSGDLVCADDSFIPMLKKLDDCLEFIGAHPDYKDSELYLVRYNQCMNRALTLIKFYFISLMRSLQAEVKEKLQSKEPGEILNASLFSSLFYVKFKSCGVKLKSLVFEIEKRRHNNTGYTALLEDCYQSYFNCRKTVLLNQIQLNVANIATDTDLLAFIRNGCAYLITVCTDEYTLFYNFFESGQEGLEFFMEDLSNPLYDQLRPLILRQTRLDFLAEVCHQLQSYTVVDQNDAQENVYSISSRMVAKKILEDAQQRLVFRAQAFMKSDLEGFKLRDDDVILFARGKGLPQPNPLECTVSMESVLPNISTKDATISPVQSVEDTTRVSISEEKDIVYGAGEWYPTLQRTIFLLGRLYQTIPASVFEDLSQECVDICRLSLVSASIVISTKQTKLDGQLFLIKNLIMLREQISKYDKTNFIRREEVLDFTGLTSAVSLILANWSLSTLGQGLMSVATPRVVQNYKDSKQLVDQELKKVCEDLILENAKAALEPISSFLLKASAFKIRNDQKPMNKREVLNKQVFAQPNQVSQIIRNFKDTYTKVFTTIIGKIVSYLGDKKTEGILIKVIKDHIIETYKKFHETVSNNYEISVIAKLESLDQLSDALEMMEK